ncbi:MAG TPA: DUF2269 family protein [Gaiellaceae bacterium]|nr:DUF2269 family protein [Gaiellaceae bacterium]
MVASAAEDAALFFHLLGAFLLVSGAVVAGVAFEAARRRRRPAEIVVLLGLSRIGVLLVGVGSVLVLPFGLWLVHVGGWGYGAGWVDAALALFAVMSLLGAAGGRRPKRARVLAQQLAREAEPETPGLRALLDDRVARVLNYVSAALLLAILVLMVFKP